MKEKDKPEDKISMINKIKSLMKFSTKVKQAKDKK